MEIAVVDNANFVKTIRSIKHVTLFMSLLQNGGNSLFFIVTEKPRKGSVKFIKVKVKVIGPRYVASF